MVGDVLVVLLVISFELVEKVNKLLLVLGLGELNEVTWLLRASLGVPRVHLHDGPPGVVFHDQMELDFVEFVDFVADLCFLCD